MRWYNPIMVFLLRSRLHVFVSRFIMLITVTGRKSGRAYTTPVSYTRNNSTLIVFSHRTRTWWRNLRGGAPVTVHVSGKEQPATAEAITDEKDVIAELRALVLRSPVNARGYRISMDSDGQPSAEDLVRVGRDLVLVRVELNASRPPHDSL